MPLWFTNKKPVLLIGGFGSVLKEFELIQKKLEEFYNPIIILIPAGNIDTVCEQIEDFLSSLHLSNLPAIGYSMGGRVLVEIAKRNQTLFSQIILSSTRLRSDNLSKEKREQFETSVINFLKKNSIEDFFKWWYELPIFANFSPPQDILDEKYKIGTNLLAEQFQNLSILKLDPPQFNNSTPIHLILGNLDPLCNEMEDCFKDSLLPIFIHKIEGCGHLTHVQKPQELCDLLQKVIL